MLIRFSVLLAVVGLLAAVERSCAEPWVANMFAEQEHNFGTVARGADAVHRFEIKNIYKQDIRLLSVRSSCGCTTASLEGDTLHTGDVGYVVANFNTRTFTGIHGATLTVSVAWDDGGVERYGEAQLRVDGNIRGDIVFQPGAVNFANVNEGSVSELEVEVTYAGRSDWQIVDVRGVADHIEAELIETQRMAGRVAYNLLVRLKDTAPAGYFNTQLILVTSDAQSPRIPLDVTGRVVPQLSVAPESVVLGEVPRGQQVSKKAIVRGKQPFRIVSIDCDEECFEFKTDDTASERHVVEIVFDADRDVGPVKETVHIATDLGERFRATLTAYATVVPAEIPEATESSEGTDASGAASGAVSTIANE